MFDTIGGLPTHPLVLHAVVVLGPIGALFAIAYALRPAWRSMLRWPTAILAVVTGAAAFVTKESGESLARKVGVDVEKNPDLSNATVKLIVDHAHAGDRAFVLCGLFMLAVLVSVFWALPAKGPDNVVPAIRTTASVLLVLFALGVLFAVFSAGHTGATAVWTSP